LASMRLVELSCAGWRSGPVLRAHAFWERLRGLIARPPDTAMLIRTRSVHGLGMTRPCRILALDARCRVLAVSVLRPGRMVSVRGASWMLELPMSIPPPPIGAVLALKG
jgi:hypothetical protein